MNGTVRRINARDVNAILSLIMKLAPDGDAQLAILIYSLGAAVKSTGADARAVLAHVIHALNADYEYCSMQDATITDVNKAMN